MNKVSFFTFVLVWPLFEKQTNKKKNDKKWHLNFWYNDKNCPAYFYESYLIKMFYGGNFENQGSHLEPKKKKQ